MINKFLSFFKKREIIRLNIYELISLDFYYGVSYIYELNKYLKKEFKAKAVLDFTNNYAVKITFYESKYKTLFILKHSNIFKKI